MAVLTAMIALIFLTDYNFLKVQPYARLVQHRSAHCCQWFLPAGIR